MPEEKAYTPLQRFRQLLKLDKKDISQVYVYALFNGLVNLSLPLGIQAIINLIQGGEMNTAWVILVSFVIAGTLLTGVLQLLQLRIVENISQKIFSRASFEFAYRIPRLKHSAMYDYYPPELANRFFDTMTIQKGMTKILIDFSLAVFQIVVGLLLLSMYHPFFILFSMILVLLVYVIIALTGPMGMRTSLKESSFKYRIAFWLEEIARTKLSFKMISGTTMSLDKSNQFVKDYLEARENHFRVLIAQFLYLVGFKVLIAAGLLITGSVLVFNQQMNIGQFVAAEIIIILIISSVEKLISSLESIYDVFTALEKIGKVTDIPLDSNGDTILDVDKNGLSLSVKGLSYRYPNSAESSLNGIDFRIPAGKSVFIHGPSSAGKSTLFRLISGILEPDSGLIQFNGYPYQSLNNIDLKAHIGYALSSKDVVHGTFLENIKMGRQDATPSRINKAMQIARLYDFMSDHPNGLQTMIDPEGRQIPRSIKDKILLARALATEPKLLLLEDPLEHVTQDEKIGIIKALTDPSQPWNIIVSSVDQVWKKFIDDEIYMVKGEIIANTLN